MFLWLDDSPERDPPFPWVIVRTAEEAIEKLKSLEVEIISLDHDLGEFVESGMYSCCGEKIEITGMDVVNWMCNNKVFPKIIIIHSWNDTASVQMYEKIKEHFNGKLIKREFDNNTRNFLQELLENEI